VEIDRPPYYPDAWKSAYSGGPFPSVTGFAESPYSSNDVGTGFSTDVDQDFSNDVDHGFSSDDDHGFSGDVDHGFSTDADYP
jgi:hypothetical protein